jgi:hypothetical protein
MTVPAPAESVNGRPGRAVLWELAAEAADSMPNDG